LGATLTLCVFVRPEGQFNVDSLSFISRQLDGVLVVSTNDTVDADRVNGLSNGRYLSVPWTDNFSHARNQALDAVETDWVFMVEHNEQLDGSMIKRVRQIMDEEISETRMHCLRIDVTDIDGHVVESTYEPRLWPICDETRFRGRIYEMLHIPSDWTFTYLDELRLVQVYEERTETEAIEIESRNLALLEKQANETPEDPHTRYCVGLSLLLCGEYQVALDTFLALIECDVGDDRTRSAQVFAIECMRQLDRAKDAFDLGLQWAIASPDYGELWFFVGRAALESSQRIKAEAAFKNATRTMKGASPALYRDPTIKTYRARIGQAQALASLRDAVRTERLLTDIRADLPEGQLKDLDEDFVRIWLQLNKPKMAFEIIAVWINREPEWASTALVKLLEYTFNAQGPTQAYLMYRQAVSAYESMLGYLPVVMVGAALSDMIEDEESYFDLLRLCIKLGSTDRSHYRVLTRLYVERGDLDAARDVADLERLLPTDSEP